MITRLDFSPITPTIQKREKEREREKGKVEEQRRVLFFVAARKTRNYGDRGVP